MAYKKPTLFNRDNDVRIEGFDFSKSDFEDLIDNFTPKDDIPAILNVSVADLDKFCNQLYAMRFSDTYNALRKLAQVFLRKAVNSLAKSGNQTALKLMAEASGLAEPVSASQGITFIANIPMTPSDVEKLNEEDEV